MAEDIYSDPVENISIAGSTGAGKNSLAYAFGHLARSAKHWAMYFDTDWPLAQLKQSKTDGTPCEDDLPYPESEPHCPGRL